MMNTSLQDHHDTRWKTLAGNQQPRINNHQSTTGQPNCIIRFIGIHLPNSNALITQPRLLLHDRDGTTCPRRSKQEPVSSTYSNQRFRRTNPSAKTQTERAAEQNLSTVNCRQLLAPSQ